MILAVRQGMTAIADLGSDATKVVHNGAFGPSTLADKASEAVILDVLRSKCPGIPVVAEEAFSHGFVPTTGDLFFLVDPLDGTKDFLAQREGYTVNVALIERTAPVAGVVGAPHSRTLYVGGVGFGAYRENDTVRNELIGRRFRRDAMVAVTSLSHPNSETADFLKRLGNTSSIEVGSSLKFCLLAEGAADLYPRYGRTMEWGIAAGDAILSSTLRIKRRSRVRLPCA